MVSVIISQITQLWMLQSFSVLRIVRLISGRTVGQLGLNLPPQGICWAISRSILCPFISMKPRNGWNYNNALCIQSFFSFSHAASSTKVLALLFTYVSHTQTLTHSDFYAVEREKPNKHLFPLFLDNLTSVRKKMWH